METWSTFLTDILSKHGFSTAIAATLLWWVLARLERRMVSMENRLESIMRLLGMLCVKNGSDHREVQKVMNGK